MKRNEFFDGQFDDVDNVDFKNGYGNGNVAEYDIVFTGHGDGKAMGQCDKHGFDDMDII